MKTDRLLLFRHRSRRVSDASQDSPAHDATSWTEAQLLRVVSAMVLGQWRRCRTNSSSVAARLRPFEMPRECHAVSGTVLKGPAIAAEIKLTRDLDGGRRGAVMTAAPLRDHRSRARSELPARKCAGREEIHPCSRSADHINSPPK